jgi:hypothetical protein
VIQSSNKIHYIIELPGEEPKLEVVAKKIKLYPQQLLAFEKCNGQRSVILMQCLLQ